MKKGKTRKVRARFAYYDNGKHFLPLAVSIDGFAFSKDEKTIITIMKATDSSFVKIVPCTITYQLPKEI